MKKIGNVLCISCKVGGGHIQAAKERIKQLQSSGAKFNILEKDLLVDLVHPLFGLPVNRFLNFILKKNWALLKNLIFRGQPISDYVVLPPWVFLRTLRLLVKKDIDTLIITQPASLMSLLQASQLAEKILKKHIKVELILSELPTSKTISFFHPIKKLAERHRNKLTLLSSRPFLNKEENEADFWQKQCGLPLSQISYASFPVRSEFLTQNQETSFHSRACSLTFFYPDRRDIESLKPLYSHGPLKVTTDAHHITLNLQENTILTTIMLGSRPLEKALLGYIDAFIHMLHDTHDDINHLVIPICSDTSSLASRAFNRLKKHALSQTESSLMIVPIPFQQAANLAPLIMRSDATITRSGGMTSIELMHVSKGQIWIHSDCPDRWQTGSIRDMPIWEIGNAEYLIQHKGAQILHPSLLNKRYSELISKKRLLINS